VACGSGYPALEAARHVRPGGSVLATDISTEMLAVAARRATNDGLENIEFLEMDAEELNLEDASFDAVTNAYGLMFCPDLPRALIEARRVLKPGGRMVLVTWDEPSKSQFFAAISAVAAPFLGLVPQAPDAPGPFRLSSPAQLEQLLRGAGFSDVRVENVSMTLALESVAEYLQVFSDLAWKARLAALSDADLARLKEEIARAVEPYLDKNSGRLRLGAMSLGASGRR